MRGTVLVVLAAGLSLVACATKPKPAPAAAACPALTPAQWGPPLQAAVDKTFGGALESRFGSKGQHGRVESSVDPRGRLVLVMERVGPARFEMPEPGGGGSVMVVLEPCTAKVVQVRKLSDLEAEPRPLAPSSEPGA